MVPWRELGNGLLFPCSSRRSGFGPCQRLTCPTYFGEAVGSELQHDVLVAIMGFIHGIEAEAHDIGVCSDPPPPWLRDEKEKVSESKDALTTDRLNWEAFLDDLGLKTAVALHLTPKGGRHDPYNRSRLALVELRLVESSRCIQGGFGIFGASDGPFSCVLRKTILQSSW